MVFANTFLTVRVICKDMFNKILNCANTDTKPAHMLTIDIETVTPFSDTVNTTAATEDDFKHVAVQINTKETVVIVGIMLLWMYSIGR